MNPLFSIIVPTKNNEDLIGRCLQSIWELDYPQDRIEIIVSDGDSTDKTREIAKQYEAKIVLDHKHSIVSGRNIAFAIAQGEFVAMCDSDCVVDKNWLKNSLKYFDNPKVAGIGGANLIPEDESPFGKAVGLLFAYSPYVIKAAHTRVLKKVIESRSHGSNAIYRADVLKKVTPVDENMVGGEDVIMNNEILDLGYKLLYVPDVTVKHYRRPNIRRWWRQMCAYGMGRVILPRKRKGEVSPLHILVGYGIPLLGVLIIILALANPLYLLWLLSSIIGLCLISLVLATIAMKDIKIGLCMPIVLSIFFVAWSWGYLRELFKRRDVK